MYDIMKKSDLVDEIIEAVEFDREELETEKIMSYSVDILSSVLTYIKSDKYSDEYPEELLKMAIEEPYKLAV